MVMSEENKVPMKELMMKESKLKEEIAKVRAQLLKRKAVLETQWAELDEELSEVDINVLTDLTGYSPVIIKTKTVMEKRAATREEVEKLEKSLRYAEFDLSSNMAQAKSARDETAFQTAGETVDGLSSDISFETGHVIQMVDRHQMEMAEALKTLRQAEAAHWYVYESSSEVTQEQEDDQVQCSICFVEFDTDETVAETDCEHMFHMKCLFQWLMVNFSCPVCGDNLMDDEPDTDSEN